ncbi:MAG: A/G-specific adenine glycosylase [Marinilabiliaceae bacterium]|nr:A/G-specific adenine glycosylase [Marinilabiliaceae bacterium]
MIDFNKRLLNWYHSNRRSLPWRQTIDPYRIWISEIILQQTQVKQGLNYYQRFINHFPNVEKLAKADEDEVLKLWQGLGYYSRARNLHTAAKSILKLHNGQFPNTYIEILKLKGIGPYTAAAISSFAFNLPHAVVDGNVYRFLSRLFGISIAIDSTPGKKHFHNLAQELLNQKNPASHNQAIMEMGALQCKPFSPSCIDCPFTDRCVAFSTGRVEDFPVKEKRTKQRHRYFSYFYMVENNKLVICKRQGNDIWRNLYELPLLESPKQLPVKSLKASLNTDHHTLQLIDEKKHILSHQIIHTRFYRTSTLPDSTGNKEQWMRVPIQELKQYAFPQLIVNFLNEQGLSINHE